MPVICYSTILYTVLHYLYCINTVQLLYCTCCGLWAVHFTVHEQYRKKVSFWLCTDTAPVLYYDTVALYNILHCLLYLYYRAPGPATSGNLPSPMTVAITAGPYGVPHLHVSISMWNLLSSPVPHVPLTTIQERPFACLANTLRIRKWPSYCLEASPFKW